MPEPLRIEFKGPLSWTAPDNESSVLYSQVAKEPGIYLWTAKTDQGYMIFYIGETIDSFRARMRQHLKKQKSGKYHYYDAEALARGKKVTPWEGVYGRNPKRSIKEYIENKSEFEPKNLEFIRNIFFFVAPAKYPKQMLKRIEDAIAEHLRSQSGKVASFFDKTKTDRRRPGEEPVNVIIHSPSELVGLPDSLVV